MAEEVVITIRGDDQASDDLRRVLGGLQDNEKAVKGVGKASGEASKGTNKAAGSMGKMHPAAIAAAAGIAAVTAAAGFAAKAIWDLTKSAAAHGDEAAKNASRMGITTEAYQELAHAAELNDVSMSEMQTGFRRMNQEMFKAQEEGSKAAEMFEDLGVDVEDSGGKLRESDAVFEDVIESLQDIESGAERSAKAQEVFGRQGSALLPIMEKSGKSISEMRQEAQDLGVVMGDDTAQAGEAFNDAFARVDAMMTGVQNTIGGAFLPAATEVVNIGIEIAQIFKDLLPPGEGMGDLIASVARTAMVNFITGAQQMISRVGQLAEALLPAASLISRVGTIAMGVVKGFLIWHKAIRTLHKAILGFLLKAVGGLVDGLSGLIGLASDLFDKLPGKIRKAIPGFEGISTALSAAEGAAEGAAEAIDGIADMTLDSAKKDVEDMQERVKDLGDTFGQDFTEEIENALLGIARGSEEAEKRLEELKAQIEDEEFAFAVDEAADDARDIAPPPSDESEATDEVEEQVEATEDLIENEEYRNELARMRMILLEEEDEMARIQMERELAIRELADQELTDQEKKLELMRIEMQFEEDLERMREEADEARKARVQEEANEIRELAGVFRDTGSQMAADIGQVVDVFADIKAGEASATDALHATGQAAASFAGQLGASAEEQAGIMAAFETAMGFATLFTNPAESVAHFLAAANFGLIAGGVVGGGSGSGGGAASGGGGSSLGDGSFRQSTEDAARAGGQVLAEELGRQDLGGGGDVVYVDFSGATMLESAPATQQRIGGAVDEAKGRQIKRRARSG